MGTKKQKWFELSPELLELMEAKLKTDLGEVPGLVVAAYIRGEGPVMFSNMNHAAAHEFIVRMATAEQVEVGSKPIRNVDDATH